MKYPIIIQLVVDSDSVYDAVNSALTRTFSVFADDEVHGIIAEGQGTPDIDEMAGLRSTFASHAPGGHEAVAGFIQPGQSPIIFTEDGVEATPAADGWKPEGWDVDPDVEDDASPGSKGWD